MRLADERQSIERNAKMFTDRRFEIKRRNHEMISVNKKIAKSHPELVSGSHHAGTNHQPRTSNLEFLPLKNVSRTT